MNLRQFNRILLQTLLLPVAALMFVAAVLGLQIRKDAQIVEHIEKSNENIANARRLAALTFDEETGVRGYQLTGNEIFLEPYTTAQTRLSDTEKDLRNGLVLEGGVSTLLLDSFNSAHQTWQVAFAEPLIQSVKNGSDTRETEINLRAKGQMDKIRTALRDIINAEIAERTQVLDNWKHQFHKTLLILIVLTLTSGLAIGLIARNRLHEVSAAFQSTLDSERRAQAALLQTENLAASARVAATLAHEIHNPLDAVSNILFLLQDPSSPEEARELLDLAKNELSRATQMSRSILNMYTDANSPTPPAL